MSKKSKFTENMTQLIFIQNEFSNNPFRRPLISSSDDSIRWLSDIKMYLNEFDDNILECN